jgi:hypothetical protein
MAFAAPVDHIYLQCSKNYFLLRWSVVAHWAWASPPDGPEAVYVEPVEENALDAFLSTEKIRHILRRYVSGA